jgi:suppressor for copper-sensitivity B
MVKVYSEELNNKCHPELVSGSGQGGVIATTILGSRIKFGMTGTAVRMTGTALGMNFLILITFFLILIVPEAQANAQRFILKNEANKLTFIFDISQNHIIYGPHQGQTGLPTRIELTHSENLKKHQLLWPQPKEEISPIGEHIHFYENHLEVPLLIEVIDKTKNTELEFALEYVLCSNQCELVKENIQTTIIAESSGGGMWLSGINMNAMWVVFLAILGGFILNFMPCVLPVLSLKILSFVKNPEINRKKASFFTIAGIISSFWVIAFVAISFKKTGKYFGLGTNFQEPNFIIALVLIITFFISISLERLSFNIPHWLSNYLSKRKLHGKYVEHYCSGILATVLSTPCNAPFLGSALFLSLEQSNIFIFIIFSFIGLGFSMPYIALLAYPKALQFLPKSGKWMNYLKSILIILLIGTLLWLLFILQNELNTRSVVGLFLLVVLIKFVLENKGSILKYFSVKVIILATLISLSFLLPKYSTNWDLKHQETVSHLWQKFEPDKIDELVRSGKIVFVDITADWCVTCKYNKYFVFGRESVIQILSDKQIVAMRGDFTNHDPKIQEFLMKRKIPGIPYNVVFGPKAHGGIDLPILLSRKDIEGGVAGAF